MVKKLRIGVYSRHHLFDSGFCFSHMGFSEVLQRAVTLTTVLRRTATLTTVLRRAVILTTVLRKSATQTTMLWRALTLSTVLYTVEKPIQFEVKVAQPCFQLNSSK